MPLAAGGIDEFAPFRRAAGPASYHPKSGPPGWASVASPGPRTALVRAAARPVGAAVASRSRTSPTPAPAQGGPLYVGHWSCPEPGRPPAGADPGPRGRFLFRPPWSAQVVGTVPFASALVSPIGGDGSISVRQASTRRRGRSELSTAGPTHPPFRQQGGLSSLAFVRSGGRTWLDNHGSTLSRRSIT